MKVYKKPVIKVKGITENKTVMKKAACSGGSSHKAVTK